MAECIKRIESDILFDCENVSIPGLEPNAQYINREDIDLAGTTFDATNKNLITNLALKTGKKGYKIQAFKKLLNGFTKPIIEDEALNGHQHSINIRVFKNDPESYDLIDRFVNGANGVVVVETKQKGENGKQAFEVLGWHVGLEVSADSAGKVYNENDGAYLLTLTTPNGFKEPRSIYKWLEVDYAKTKAKFENNIVKPTASV